MAWIDLLYYLLDGWTNWYLYFWHTLEYFSKTYYQSKYSSFLINPDFFFSFWIKNQIQGLSFPNTFERSYEVDSHYLTFERLPPTTMKTTSIKLFFDHHEYYWFHKTLCCFYLSFNFELMFSQENLQRKVFHEIAEYT